MAVLDKFEITYKDSKDDYVYFPFQYNPNQLSISKSVVWEGFAVSGEDSTKKQFSSGKAKTLSIGDVLFDTSMFKSISVYKKYIRYLEAMTLGQEYTKEGITRPPILTLSWGNGGYFFEAILINLNYEFSMFDRSGIPIRASVSFEFEEIITDTKKIKSKLDVQVITTYRVKSKDTLQKIAESELGSATKWKMIAVANGIDNPNDLEVGMQLTIPSED